MLHALQPGHNAQAPEAQEFTRALQRLTMGDALLSPLSLICANPELAGGGPPSVERFDGAELPYLWADGIHLGAGPRGERRVLLLVLGADAEGRRHIVELRCAGAETEAAWLELFRDLRSRGLGAPKLIIADGTAGFWRAARSVFPESSQQWCWLHVERQILKNLTGIARSGALTALRGIAAAASENEARTLIAAFAEELQREAPFVAASLREELERLVAYLRFDPRIRVTLRTTHAVEAVFMPVAV
jgi:transposase-like protein